MAVPGQNHWTLEATMKQLDQESRNFHSLTADIERTKVTVVVNDKSTESGKLFVRRDDKMRIEFAEPDAKTLLRSGNDLFLYNPKIKQVEEYDLGKHRALVDQFLAPRLRHFRNGFAERVIWSPLSVKKKWISGR